MRVKWLVTIDRYSLRYYWIWFCKRDKRDLKRNYKDPNHRLASLNGSAYSDSLYNEGDSNSVVIQQLEFVALDTLNNHKKLVWSTNSRISTILTIKELNVICSRLGSNYDNTDIINNTLKLSRCGFECILLWRILTFFPRSCSFFSVSLSIS